MSDAPGLSELEALAAEHALGVLSAGERAEAELRMARDPEFARLVEAWRARLSPMLQELAETAPSAAVWTAVERALPANDDLPARRRLRFWRGATVGSLGLAAASLALAIVAVSRPPVVLRPPPPGPVLNASLMSQGADARPMFVAAYDPARQALIVTSMATPGADPAHVHQLWVIPADGKPHPLGMIAPGASKAMPMPKDMVPMFAPGAAIAVSVEPPGGSPMKDQPSGPIAAMGRLGKI